MILPFDMTLAANETREVALSGKYFELRKCAALVTLIELNDESGGVISKMAEADATDSVSTSNFFKMVRITNGPTAQAIRFYFGVGRSGSNRFTGVVSGTVALDAASLAALEYIQVRPEAATGTFTNIAALAANTPVTIFSTASNPNGAILLSAEISEFDPSLSHGGFIAKAGTAPALVTDGELLLACRYFGAYSTTNLIFGGTLTKEQFIPANYGLYFFRTIALAAGNGNIRACRYRLL